MNLNFKKVFVFLFLSVVALPGNAEEFYSSIIREKALANGYAPPRQRISQQIMALLKLVGNYLSLKI